MDWGCTDSFRYVFSFLSHSLADFEDLDCFFVFLRMWANCGIRLVSLMFLFLGG